LLHVWGMLTNPAGMNTLTHAIIGCGIRVHREIGPGVLENIYNECMQYELRHEGLRFDRERAVLLVYKGQKLKSRYYIDLVVEDRVIVELKAVAEVVEIHRTQVLTQLRLAGLHIASLPLSPSSLSLRSLPPSNFAILSSHVQTPIQGPLAVRRSRGC
jgi:GxxExxY protein